MRDAGRVVGIPSNSGFALDWNDPATLNLSRRSRRRPKNTPPPDALIILAVAQRLVL